MNTQIIKLGPGETIILPSGAQIISVTEFSGGVATSDCSLPPSIGTDTYYWFIDENPAENGDQQFFMESMVIGNAISGFPVGFKPAAVALDGSTIFINTVKSNAAVLELRVKNYSGSNNKAFSITVPKGTPMPYFVTYFTNDSTPWYFRFYPLETTDSHYSSTVTDLDSSTIK